MIKYCKREQYVYLTGPKGCGKTFTLAALFIAYWKKSKEKDRDCIFLTPKLLQKSTDSEFKKRINYNLLLTEENVNTVVENLLGHFSDLWVFVDFSFMMESSSLPLNLITTLNTYAQCMTIDNIPCVKI